MKKVLTIKMLLLAAATLAITLGPDPADASARRAIRLRVNDAVAEPGGLVAVVVRTYAPRPISQGQISVRTKRKGRTRRVAQDAAEAAVRMPLTLENYKVFSRRDDAKVSVRVETQGNSQNVILQFSSKSGTINRADGPLAVLYFRLAPNVKPRQEFELTINADQTFVVNPNGKPIRFEPKPGVLRVRGPGAHHRLEIEGDTVRAGDLARLELQTFEPVAMSQGHLEVKYDPSIATGAPKVARPTVSGRVSTELVMISGHKKLFQW